MNSSDLSDFDEENDEILRKERERRMAGFKPKAGPAIYGQLETLHSERDLLSEYKNKSTTTTGEHVVILHFFMAQFQRCREMSEALAGLAMRYPHIRFCQVDACQAPFLTSKWAIKQLPCVVKIEGTEGVDKIVGFEGVSDEMARLDVDKLEARLIKGDDGSGDGGQSESAF